MTYFVKLTAPSTTTMDGKSQEEYGVILNVANIRSVIECKPGDERAHGFPESGCVLYMDNGNIHPVKEGLAEVWEALVGPEDGEDSEMVIDIDAIQNIIERRMNGE